MSIKVILTGATGLVGEGVLLTCLENPAVGEVLAVTRKPVGISHAKLKELIVPDFFKLDGFDAALSGYDACFYCAGISSRGMNEADYSFITYDTTLHFAKKLLALNPGMVFSHISGSHTDSSEKSKIMWARVKGKAENALMRLPFKKVYNFRPALMKPFPGQKNIKTYYKIINALSPLFAILFPGKTLNMKDVGTAMINSVLVGYPKQVLEVSDIKILAAVVPSAAS